MSHIYIYICLQPKPSAPDNACTVAAKASAKGGSQGLEINTHDKCTGQPGSETRLRRVLHSHRHDVSDCCFLRHVSCEHDYCKASSAKPLFLKVIHFCLQVGCKKAALPFMGGHNGLVECSNWFLQVFAMAKAL